MKRINTKKLVILCYIFIALSLYIKVLYAANIKKKSQQSQNHHSIKRRTRSLKSSKQVTKKNITPKISLTNNTKEIESNKPQKQDLKKENELLSRLTCDSKYMKCMNKFCSNDKIGKCVCYEDNYTNTKDKIEFVDIDGIQIKKGFDLLNYSKNECAEFLNKCPDDKRGIFLKYKNFIQRDCLLLSDKIIEKGDNLATELKELEECMRPVCTTNKKDLSGQEDFSFAPFHLCFDELTAKFAMGAYCSKIIKKSKSSIALEQLFLDTMLLRKERSCISMGGIFSADKNCYISIEYGQSKDSITSTMLFPVGSLLHCTAKTFGVELEEDYYARQNRRNKRLKMAATAFTVAGIAFSVAGSFLDPIGGALNTAIAITETVVDVGITSADYAKGKISTKNYAKSLGMSAMSIALSAMSFAGFAGDAGKFVSQISAVVSSCIGTLNSIVEGGLTIKDCVKKNLSKEECVQETIRISAELAANIISLTTSSINLSNTVAESRRTSLSNAETRVTEAQTKVAEAKAKLSAATDKAAKAKAKNALKVAEANLQSANGDLKIAQAKANVKNAESRATRNEAKAELNRVKAEVNADLRLTKAENKLAKAKTETEIKAAKAELTAIQTETQNALKIADADLKVAKAKTKVSEATNKVAKAEAKAELKTLKTEAKNIKIDVNKSTTTKVEYDTMQKFSIGMEVTKGITDITSSAIDLGMSNEIAKEKKKEEELGLSSKPILDRNAGIGKVEENRETINGNCFFNGEFFATEEEQTFLLWKD